MSIKYLFVDMNAYFASVEQQHRPELRGRPVGVVPVLADTTCCIAASYEAKAFGVKTGTLVRDARRLCPGIRLVEARPRLYVATHRRILAAVETCLPVGQILSVDELACRLLGEERRPDRARDLAGRVKAAIFRDVGEVMRCSVGIAPNVLLAKVAADMQKPDGLTLIESGELPGRLYPLRLTDLPGVGRRMERRLHGAGVRTVEQLCRLSADGLSRIWGSRVLGRRWWHRLRGADLPDPPTRRRSVGHSHVLPPELRNEAGARAVLTRLLHRAAARMRLADCWAGSLTVAASFLGGPPWHRRVRLGLRRDTLTLLRVLGSVWDERPRGTPLKVGVVLGDLAAGRNVPAPLFAEDRRLAALADAMDWANRLFGEDAVYFGGMHGARDKAPQRIAFNRIPDL